MVASVWTPLVATAVNVWRNTLENTVNLVRNHVHFDLGQIDKQDQLINFCLLFYLEPQAPTGKPSWDSLFHNQIIFFAKNAMWEKYERCDGKMALWVDINFCAYENRLLMSILYYSYYCLFLIITFLQWNTRTLDVTKTNKTTELSLKWSKTSDQLLTGMILKILWWKGVPRQQKRRGMFERVDRLSSRIASNVNAITPCKTDM